MTEITDPTSQIYSKLSELDTLVLQSEPEIKEVIPCIIFSIPENIPDYMLDKEVGRQRVTVNVDIYGKTSIQSGAIVKAVELKMREINYLCTFNASIPEPEKYSHRRLQFTY